MRRFVCILVLPILFLACDASPFDPCGDGTLQTDEECEALELRGETCASQGFAEGELRCSDTCTLDTSSCQTCGDGVRSGDEACDEQDFGGQTCSDFGFEFGYLSCPNGCQGEISTSACSNPAGLGGPCPFGTECTDELLCVRADGEALCRQECTAAEPCTSGFRCVELSSGNGETTSACLPGNADGEPCPCADGFVCTADSAGNLCRVACLLDGDGGATPCPDEMRCLAFSDGDGTNGACVP